MERNNKTYTNQSLRNLGGDLFPGNSTKQEKGQLVISDEMMWQFNLYIYILLCGAVSTFGTLSNATNMVVFYKLHLKDSMSVCLFALSLTDFLVSMIVMVGRVFPIWNIFYKNQGIDPMAILYAGPSWMADSLFLCSGWILTVLSLERCVCVTFPFKVKDIFTRNRSIVAVILIYAVTVSTYIPIYMTQWLRWVDGKVQTDNGTVVKERHHLVIVLSDNRVKVQATVHIFNSTVIPVPALILTMGSVLWMVHGLTASSKLRDAMTSSHVVADEEKKDSSIRSRTRTLVKVVLLLAIIFLVCSIPRIIAKSINTIFPEVNEGGRGRNLNNFLWQFARFSACLNASINIFVYLKINSSYKVKFQEIFSFKSPSGK